MKVFLASCQIHQNIYHSMCDSMCELLYKMIAFSYVSIEMIFLNNFPTSRDKKDLKYDLERRQEILSNDTKI